MILPPDLAKKALEGRVTMACFPRTGPKCVFRVDHAYALQAGKRTIERVTVREVREAIMSELDLRDAKRLGFRTRTDFFERWKGPGEVWLVRFEMGDNSDTPRMPAAKFGAHGDYTSSASQSLHGSSEEVSSMAHARFAREASEGAQIARNGLYSEHIAKLQATVREMRACSVEPRAHENLRGIERQVAALQRKLTAQV